MFKGFCTTKSSIVSTIVSSDLLEQDLFTYYESLLVRNALNFQAEFFFVLFTIVVSDINFPHHSSKFEREANEFRLNLVKEFALFLWQILL